MSVYSRCVEARGTISIESTPAPCHPSKPVFCSRRGSGASVGGPGCALDRRAVLHEVRLRVEAVLGLHGQRRHDGFTSGPGDPADAPGPCSLSSATTVSTRLSIPCTYDTAEAPSEWPMIATRRVRPRRRSCGGRAMRSNSFHSGLKRVHVHVARVPARGSACRGVERKKLSASCVPVDEVRVLLGGHARAAEVLARRRRRERVAERHRVHLVVLVRERLRACPAPARRR